VQRLPVEVDAGLLRVQCVALQRRLAERAERLATTLLLALQVHAWFSADREGSEAISYVVARNGRKVSFGAFLCCITCLPC
jgi:hypothetical protein